MGCIKDLLAVRLASVNARQLLPEFFILVFSTWCVQKAKVSEGLADKAWVRTMAWGKKYPFIKTLELAQTSENHNYQHFKPQPDLAICADTLMWYDDEPCAVFCVTGVRDQSCSPHFAFLLMTSAWFHTGKTWDLVCCCHFSRDGPLYNYGSFSLKHKLS